MLMPVLNAAHFNNELFFADSRNNNVINENILKKYTSLFHDQQKYPTIKSPPNQPWVHDLYEYKLPTMI